MARKDKYRILAFDPGMTITGWSLIEGDITNKDLLVLKLGAIEPGPTVNHAAYREEVARYDKRTISLSYLKEQVIKLIDEFNPDVITAEDIYINMRMPQAYGSLCMWIAIVRAVCRDHARKYLVTIPTKICKLEISGSGSNGKLPVQQSIAASEHIKFKDENDLCHMTEHQADSIAVANALAARYHDLIVKEVEARNERQ